MTFNDVPAHVAESARSVPLFGSFDVVVLGGGPAGIAAACAAARNGANVLLVERYGFLGGMGTAAGVTNFCGLHANVYGDIRQVVRGVAGDLLQRMHDLDGLNEPHLVLGKIHAQAYDMSAFKCAADGLLLADGVQLLFHALAAGVIKSGDGRIDAILLETKSGRVAVRGNCFIDCSGDADLAHWAGVPTEKGDESGQMLYPTLMFRVGEVDPVRAGEAWRTIPKLMDSAEDAGEFSFPRRGAVVRPQKRAYEWRVNVTQLKNPDGSATDGTDARIVVRRDAPALAAAIVELAGDERTRMRLALNARATGAGYDISVFVRKMERLYTLLHQTSRATRRTTVLREDMSVLTGGVS